MEWFVFLVVVIVAGFFMSLFALIQGSSRAAEMQHLQAELRSLRSKVSRLESEQHSGAPRPRPADALPPQDAPTQAAPAQAAPVGEAQDPSPPVRQAIPEETPPPLPSAATPKDKEGLKAKVDRERVAEPPSDPTGEGPSPEPGTASAPRPVQEILEAHRESREAPTPSPSSAAARTPNRETSLDWEQWLGIRGAAVVGGIALVLAGLFFVQVAIERGWLGPAARDAIALGLGSLGLLAHLPLRRRGFNALADSVGGAGVVLVYGAAWAAAQLHGLVPTGLALMVMAAGTGTAILLAVRSSAPILIAFALLGGFATPILMDTLDSGPAAFFGYALVLNLGLLAASRIRRWPWLIASCVAGTTVLQSLWILDGRGVNPWAAAGILGVFAAMLAAAAAVTLRALDGEDGQDAARRDIDDPDPFDGALASRLALFSGLLAPAILSSLLVLQPGQSTTIWPGILLHGVLLLAATFASGITRTRLYVVCTAVGAGLANSFWAMRVRAIRGGFGSTEETRLGLEGTWEAWALGALALTTIPLVASRRAADRVGATISGLLALLTGWMVVSIPEQALPGALFPALHGVLLVLGLVGASGERRSRGLGITLALTAGIGLAIQAQAVDDLRVPFDGTITLGVALIAAALAMGGRALLARAPEFARAALVAAPFMIAPSIAALTWAPSALPHTPTALAALLLAGAGAVGIRMTTSDRPMDSWSASALLLMGFAAGPAIQTWSFRGLPLEGWTGSVNLVQVLVPAVALLLPLGLAAGTVLNRRAVGGDGIVDPAGDVAGRWAGAAASLPAIALLAGPSKVARQILDSPFGDVPMLGLVAAMLIVPGLLLARRSVGIAPAGRILGTAALLAAIALARGVAEQPSLVGPTLGAGAIGLLAAWSRDRTGAVLTPVLGIMGAVGLMVATLADGAFDAEPLWLPVQLSVDHGLAAAGLVLGLLAARRMNEDEPARKPLGLALALTLLALGFTWVNAVVFNHFATGDRIRVDFERFQARDLTLSLAWAAYGGALLTAGLLRKAAWLRWMSLAVFLGTIFKVFLHDLGSLEGLPRVGSFLGLAVALMLVSLGYSRVLGAPARDRDGDDVAPDEIGRDTAAEPPGA